MNIVCETPLFTFQHFSTLFIVMYSLFLFCFRQVNISLVVNDSEAEECVRALHHAFFETEFSELQIGYTNGNGSVPKSS